MPNQESNKQKKSSITHRDFPNKEINHQQKIVVLETTCETPQDDRQTAKHLNFRTTNRLKKKNCQYLNFRTQSFKASNNKFKAFQ